MHPLYQVLTTNLTTPRGFFPSQIRHAYGFDQLSCSFTKPWGSPALCGSGQTIAIVDAFDDPVIESDLAAFDNQFGIPACSTANGCFTKATPEGQPNPSNAGNDGNHDWAREMDVDVEWAHAIAPGAKILLVETLDNSNGNLFPGVDYAASRPGVSQVSLSWGGAETGGKTSNGQLELSFDIHFKTPGVSFLVASGDNGGENEWYPAASPWVIGVGGTNLTLDGSGNVLKETAWSGSGGGISPYEPEPSYQVAYGISSGGFRSVPDVSYLGAGPYAVYDGFGAIGATGWFTGGGTSFGAPQWAALLAIVNSGRTSPLSSASFGSEKVVYNAATGSAYSLNFRDVIVGSNGKCGAICTAGPGYDFVTGLGSPLANNLLPFLRHS